MIPLSNINKDDYNKNFLLTEEEKEFRVQIRQFVLDEIAPEAEKIEDEDNFSIIRKIYKKLGENNLLSLPFKKFSIKGIIPGQKPPYAIPFVGVDSPLNPLLCIRYMLLSDI